MENHKPETGLSTAYIQLMTTERFCALAGVADDTVKGWIANGRTPTQKIDKNH